jgi:hypothetical protein
MVAHRMSKGVWSSTETLKSRHSSRRLSGSVLPVAVSDASFGPYRQKRAMVTSCRVLGSRQSRSSGPRGDRSFVTC